MSNRVNLGLTFYGGVSLAVFEAGIAYELVRATQFSRARSKPASVPEIHVDVVTGTSAGGLAAVQLAAALAGTNTEGVLAGLVSIWANDADIQSLLPSADFPRQALLDNQRLGDRARDLLEVASVATSERPLEEDLDIFLTLTNLSGLREPVILADDPTCPTFPSTRHVEYEHFSAAQVTDPDERQRLVEAALITAGFPIAFAPGVKPSSAIDEGRPAAEATRFVYVDGGVMDNRPLGIALDTIAEKPAPKRLFFFIDPNETWVPPAYGADDLDQRRLDPAGIYSKIGSVARSDSIFRDLAQVRGMYDALAVLKPLSRAVCQDRQLRDGLRTAYGEVMQRQFNPEAWALWLLVKGAVGAAVEAEWARVSRQDRFALRARLHELVDLLQEDGKLDAALAEQIKGEIDTAAGWAGYYQALGALRALDKRFRQLKYQLWHEHFRHEPRWRGADGGARRALRADLQEAVRAAFADLAAAAETLGERRKALAQELLTSQVLSRLAVSDQRRREIDALFDDYAQAMQVLEALAGIRSTPNLAVRCITPFDIYSDETDLATARPLAGGVLGAFGGFLDKEWRLNDFFVGRLAMRAQLRREGLIPQEAFDAYCAWSAERDRGTIARLQPGSAEALAMAELAALRPPATGYRGDPAKPAWLLDSGEMAIDRLPGSRLARIVRKLLGSARRILRLNREQMPYRALRAVAPALLIGGWLAWILEQSLRPVPHPAGDTTKAFLDRLKWYLTVLLIGAVLGFLAAQLVPG